MARFGKALEPGEVVRWRHPPTPTRKQWVVKWTWAIAAGIAMFSISLWVLRSDGILPAILAGVIAGSFIMNPVYDLRKGWVVVTDRRLLAGHLAILPRSTEFPISEVEGLYTDTANKTHVVRGGGKEIRVNCEWVDLDTLKRLLAYRGRQPL